MGKASSRCRLGGPFRVPDSADVSTRKVFLIWITDWRRLTYSYQERECSGEIQAELEVRVALRP